MHFPSHIQTAIQLLNTYNGDTTFASFIKEYFAKNKKHGSSDRRRISEWCYAALRTGRLYGDSFAAENLPEAVFLCVRTSTPLLKLAAPDLDARATMKITDKLSFLGHEDPIPALFPFTSYLSPKINVTGFALSHLEQPLLFIRVRPGKEEIVRSKLENLLGVSRFLDTHTVSLPNGFAVDDHLKIDDEVVIQDANSQRVLFYFYPELKKIVGDDPFTVWDCCAASGGKAIQLYDLFNSQMTLTVSDVRPKILYNLEKRFETAGIKKYHSWVADLTGKRLLPGKPQDFILCDAPCSGSGTWGRTPEYLRHFEPALMPGYTSRQQTILRNIQDKLKPGGHLLYITCSVFEAENEEMIAWAKKEFNLSLIEAKYFAGYDMGADTMFGALLQKPVAS
jgi:16S rRNA (cytosine967-C5)-methyltransferase